MSKTTSIGSLTATMLRYSAVLSGAKDLTRKIVATSPRRRLFPSIKEWRACARTEQFESWLFAIAHNVWCSLIESRRAQKRSATLLSFEWHGENDDRPPIVAGLAASDADPLTVTLDKEKLEKLREALDICRRRCAAARSCAWFTICRIWRLPR